MATFSVCDSFVSELFQGIHTPSDTYKMAIFARDATAGRLGRATTAYAATVNGATEVTYGNALYNGGGLALTKDGTAGQADGTTTNVRLDTVNHAAGYDWANAVFSNVTISGLRANGFYALIYNASKANRAVAVGEWIANELANDPTAADFTVTLPSSGSIAVKVTT